MAGVDIRGTVRYVPGPWGRARPAAGVEVKVIDVDIGNANDSIWSGVTDSNGAFSGTTADWRDMRTVTVGSGRASVTSQVADPSDVMLLRVQISQRLGARLFQVELPFVPAPPGLPPPPLLVPWGPAGRGRLVVNASPVPTLRAFATRLGQLFDTGAAVAGQQVRHEITIFGEGVAMLRGEVERLEVSLRELESAALALVPRVRADLRSTGDRVQAQAGPITRNVSRAAETFFDAGIAATGRASDPNAAQREVLTAQQKMEELRQRLVAFLAGLEPIFQRAAVAADAAWQQAIAPVAVKVVQIIVATVSVALQAASLGVGSTVAALAVAAVAAVAVAVVTVIQNVPVLLRLAGCETAATDMETWIGLNTWFGTMLTVIVVVCALIVLAASAPAAAWAWAIERVTGADGAEGMRFVFSR